MTEPIIKPEQICNGDTLRITVLVTAEDWGQPGANAGLELSPADLASAKIELLDRPALKVGAKVKWPRKYGGTAVIKAIDGDEAWVKWFSGDRSYSTVRLSDLVPA